MVVKFIHNIRTRINERFFLVFGILRQAITSKPAHVMLVRDWRVLIGVFVRIRLGQERPKVCHQIKWQEKNGTYPPSSPVQSTLTIFCSNYREACYVVYCVTATTPILVVYSRVEVGDKVVYVEVACAVSVEDLEAKNAGTCSSISPSRLVNTASTQMCNLMDLYKQ